MDFSPLANALVQFDDENYVKTKGLPILQQRFEQVDVAAWERLLHYYSPALFAPTFMEMGQKKNLAKFIHLLKIVQQLADTERPLIANFVQQQLDLLPAYLETLKIYDFSKSAYGDQLNGDFVFTKEAVELLLSLYHLRPSDDDWQQSILTQLTLKMPRPYVNEALIPTYMEQFSKVNNPMAQTLLKECIIDLKKRTAKEPQPPADIPRGPNIDVQQRFLWNVDGKFFGRFCQLFELIELKLETEVYQTKMGERQREKVVGVKKSNLLDKVFRLGIQ